MHKAIGIAITIIIALLISTLGYFALNGGIPNSASLVSVSQVNLQPGGTLQGSYLLHTYWDVVLTANSYQNLALTQVNFGPDNNSQLSGNNLNGQTVTPSTQLYVTINPLKPYLTTPISEDQLKYSPNANGIGDPISEVNCVSSCTSQGTASTVPSESLTYYYPTTGIWSYHYPINITVSAVGGPNPFTQSRVIDVENTPSITFTNPANSAQTLQITNLGNLEGALSQPNPGTSTVFFQGTNNGVSEWYGFYDALSAIESSFPQYWYGSSTSFTQLNGQSTPNTNFWPNGKCDSTVHPGWEQSVTYNPYMGQINNPSYFYTPISPPIAGTISPINTTKTIYTENTGRSGFQINEQTTFCTNQAGPVGTQLPTSLVDWLGWSGVKQFNFNPYASPNSGTINSTMLVIPAPTSAWTTGTIATPEMQLLVSSELVNTIVYQVNNAQFKINSITSTQNSIQAGASTTVTLSIQNTASYTGTATVSYYDALSKFSVNPPTTSLTLGAGASGQVQFTLTGLATTSATQDTIHFYVQNDAYQITDSKSIQLTDTPQFTGGNPNFVITNINAPKSISVGGQGTLSISIQNLGGSGSALIQTTSETPSVATVAPQNYTQAIGSGVTSTVSLTIVGISANNGTQTATFDITILGGVQPVTTKISVQITPSGSVPCQFTNSCPPNGSNNYDLIYAGIAVAMVAIVGVSIYLYRRQ
ncbi:MAG: hypothetical protein KGN01_06415 [Patescibacteria group bacterium]|nr:hypothetical protein [Patescibacteria group bacterium]